MTKFYKQRPGTLGELEYHQMPAAPLYVVSNDAFMSELGKMAGKGKKNVCVVPVYSQQEANAVYNYVETRSEQKYLRLNCNPPRDRDGVLYALLLGWVGRALEREHRGNREAIVAEHFERAARLTDKELREFHQVSVNARHECEVCYFCICGIEASFRAARKLSDAKLKYHADACAKNGCDCSGYAFTCICGRVIKERKEARFQADVKVTANLMARNLLKTGR